MVADLVRDNSERISGPETELKYNIQPLRWIRIRPNTKTQIWIHQYQSELTEKFNSAVIHNNYKLP